MVKIPIQIDTKPIARIIIIISLALFVGHFIIFAFVNYPSSSHFCLVRINARYIIASTVTIVAPTGVPPRIDINIPGQGCNY